MANTKSARKRIRSSERKRKRNQAVRSLVKTQVKKAHLALESGDVGEAREQIAGAISVLDRAASKGVLHKNNAARRKSRLIRRLRQLEASA